MPDQLGLTPGQRVLEIGAGTGYNAALISHLVSPGGEVVSIDIDIPDGGVLNPDAVLTALDAPPTVRSTHAVISPKQVVTDLGLWLALHEPVNRAARRNSRWWCMATARRPQGLPTSSRRTWLPGITREDPVRACVSTHMRGAARPVRRPRAASWCRRSTIGSICGGRQSPQDLHIEKSPRPA
ncbi:hypothetical protein [Micromonospora sp. NBC_01699]|uniref:hypothetical protein n=1 Tax=Micromonospora sp. NBC_01699 TaxID=2975984 RepID=UPI003FA5590D